MVMDLGPEVDAIADATFLCRQHEFLALISFNYLDVRWGDEGFFSHLVQIVTDDDEGPQTEKRDQARRNPSFTGSVVASPSTPGNSRCRSRRGRRYRVQAVIQRHVLHVHRDPAIGQ